MDTDLVNRILQNYQPDMIRAAIKKLRRKAQLSTLEQRSTGLLHPYPSNSKSSLPLESSGYLSGTLLVRFPKKEF